MSAALATLPLPAQVAVCALGWLLLLVVNALVLERRWPKLFGGAQARATKWDNASRGMGTAHGALCFVLVSPPPAEAPLKPQRARESKRGGRGKGSPRTSLARACAVRARHGPAVHAWRVQAAPEIRRLEVRTQLLSMCVTVTARDGDGVCPAWRVAL